MWRLPQRPWVQRLGDVEGGIALVCTIVVLTWQTTPADRFTIPWLWIAVWAVGMGTGLGGVRFGASFGGCAGAVALSVLGLLLIAILASHLIRSWLDA